MWPYFQSIFCECRVGALFERGDCIMKSSSHAFRKCTRRGGERMCHCTTLCSKSKAFLSYWRFSSHMVSHISTSGNCPLFSQPVVLSAVQMVQRQRTERKILPFFLLSCEHQPHRITDTLISCRAKTWVSHCFTASDQRVPVHVGARSCVHTPTGLPTGSSQAEDFGTEQLSAYTPSREMTLQQEELFNLSRVKNKIQDEACIFVMPVSSWFFFLTSLVASLVLLWWLCTHYVLKAHLKVAEGFSKEGIQGIVFIFCSSKYDYALLETSPLKIYCAIDSKHSQRNTHHQLTQSQIKR